MNGKALALMDEAPEGWTHSGLNQLELERRRRYRRLIHEVGAQMLVRLNAFLPEWVWDDEEMLRDILEAPRLTDYLVAEGIALRREQESGISRNWVDGFSTRFVRPYAVPRPVFGDGLLRLAGHERTDLVYHDSFLPQVRQSDDRHESEERRGHAKGEKYVLIVEELDRDPIGRDAMRQYLFMRSDGQRQQVSSLPTVIWLVLMKLPRDYAPQRYFFINRELGHWNFCKWDGATWTFYDGQYQNNKGERLFKGDRVVLYERSYR